MLRGRGIPPPPPPVEALGRGKPLRGAARDRVGVDVPEPGAEPGAEPGVEGALTGCLRARGEGVAGIRSLLGEGTGRRGE